ncbi:hypothetical protein COLO4_20548 [Corchorus olitorius]|uniref:DUF7903 domain-containing protein n=1 Tax=Corchorus olitorius TaxID=93759 RepID=A0A1R3IZ34_9ROSI|nr:hypothetical protein COLO4_20548 [Corchorus olitorius]
MAYIPPHKRQSKDSESPTLTPESLVPQFRRNVHLRSPKPNADRSGKIVYASYAISKWFAVGLDDGNEDCSAARLVPVSVESVERRSGEKPVILVKNLDKENNEVKGSPCPSIVENILPDLLSSFEIARSETASQNLVEVKPTLVARFGKILFHGSPSVKLESIRKDCVTETTLRNLKRSFYTSLPASYVGNIIAEVVPKIGVDFEEVKHIYHVKLSDSTQPDSTISCKCSVKDDEKLQLYKVELNQVRDMVVDISCPNMDLDLRLMLCHKKILTSLNDDEIQSIKNLVDSAVLDPDVKGGLRWPLGKASTGERFSVVGVWHTTATSYQSSSMRLKVRHADRFDFRTSYGESSKEVVLKLKGIVSGLLIDIGTTALFLALKDFTLEAAQTSKVNLGEESNENYNVGVGNPIVPTFVSIRKMSLGDHAFFLLTFIACTTSVAFTSLVVAAVPTLHAMGKAAVSLSKLADAAREELPSTMAAIRLSGMEISDLTLELSDLSQEIADGVNKSAQAVQAAEAGIRKIGSVAHQQTMFAGAARKTSHAVGQATKTIMKIIYRGEFSSENEDDSIDRVEI